MLGGLLVSGAPLFETRTQNQPRVTEFNIINYPNAKSGGAVLAGNLMSYSCMFQRELVGAGRLFPVSGHVTVPAFS
jgi:hypothetical protein